MTHRSQSFIVGVLLTSQLLAGCTSWQAVQVSPQEFVQKGAPQAIQVWDKSWVNVVLSSPTANGDSLTGTVRGVRTSVPWSTVDSVGVKKFSSGKTVGLVIGITAATVLLGAVAAESYNSSWNNMTWHF